MVEQMSRHHLTSMLQIPTYFMNNMHDVWYQYGFDEASRNFKISNYGRVLIKIMCLVMLKMVLLLVNEFE
jgi:hypothetical protein